MKPFIYLLILLLSVFTAKAQTVTLSVYQPEPLQMNSGTTVFNILQGKKQTLGNDLSISGGTAPYQTSWTSLGWLKDSIKTTITVTPKDTTVYACKVTDAKGCTQEQSFQVNVVFPVVLNATATQISCYGKQNGTINLNISGGAKPYTIAWLDGSSGENRNNLGAGTYAVTVTDAMNQQQDTTITLIEQARIEVSLTASVCEGNSYAFDNKELSTAGNYSATFKSADGCDSVVSLSLTINPVFEATETAAICQGETYAFAGKQLSATGQYNNKLQSVTGCDSTIVLNLTVNPLPDVPTITQSKKMLTSSATTGNQWWKGNTEISGGVDQTLAITEDGDYSVMVTNTNGCSSQSATFHATITAVPVIDAAGFSCTIFPNPNKGLFMVEIESATNETIQLELFSVDGKSIARQQLSQQSGRQSIQFGKENLTKGVYNLQVRYGSKTVNRKLVVN